MIKVFQQVLKTAIKIFNKDFERMHWDRAYFRSLGRRPPELMWQPCPPGPELRQDAASIQVGRLWYVIAGYRDADTPLDVIDVFDLHRRRWVDRFPIAGGMAQTHLGVACENDRYLYCITGQVGPQCSPATNRCFACDLATRQWSKLPRLPEARYAPTVSLWQGRLHVIGGSQEDRTTPAVEHWSIAVRGGEALESHWRSHAPIPRGGPHRASVVLDNKLYVFGGQEGDYVPIPGDSACRCKDPKTPEVFYADSFVLDTPKAAQWRRIADMPVKSSHTEFAYVIVNGKAVLLGGMEDKDPATKVVYMTDAIQVYDPSQEQWRIAGRLPYRIKATVAAYYKGWLYFTTGQKDKGPDDPTPGWHDDRVWRARFSV